MGVEVMPNYLWQCQNCEETKRLENVAMADRDIPPPDGDECTHAWARIFEMPMILKESFPSGHRNKNDQDYSNMLKASKLGTEMLKHRHGSEERELMVKEKHKLEGKSTGVTTRKPTEEKKS
jgi:hypothetical protein